MYDAAAIGSDDVEIKADDHDDGGAEVAAQYNMEVVFVRVRDELDLRLLFL